MDKEGMMGEEQPEAFEAIGISGIRSMVYNAEEMDKWIAVAEKDHEILVNTILEDRDRNYVHKDKLPSKEEWIKIIDTALEQPLPEDDTTTAEELGTVVYNLIQERLKGDPK
jgi:hypothetical protein